MTFLPSRAAARLAIAFSLALAAACAHGISLAPSTSPLEHLTKAERLATLERAQVWTATDIPSMDLRAGPQGKGAYPPFAQVSCNYVEEKMSGTSAKFTCELAPGDQVKVKYGTDNVEVYGVVAASRLLWALGFGADRWYPVSVTCHDCPADPHTDIHHTSNDVTFDIAAIERKASGKTIETTPDQGWKWPELEEVDEAAGGATRAQRDALKLLAVMIQHTDSKQEQQRMVCLATPQKDAPGMCGSPFMLIHDVGLTFGSATLFNRNAASGPNLVEWSKQRVWQDDKLCVGNLSKSWNGTFGSPHINEPGRKFLADLLTQLSDAQLRDMFEVARFPQHSHTTVDAWVTVFKQKRAEIVGASCPL